MEAKLNGWINDILKSKQTHNIFPFLLSSKVKAQLCLIGRLLRLKMGETVMSSTSTSSWARSDVTSGRCTTSQQVEKRFKLFLLEVDLIPRPVSDVDQ